MSKIFLLSLAEAFLEEQLAYQDAKYPGDLSDLSGWQPDETLIPLWTYCCTPHCCEPAERPPPTTESEVRQTFEFEFLSLQRKLSLGFCVFQLLQAFYRQQDEIRGLREELHEKDVSTPTVNHLSKKRLETVTSHQHTLSFNVTFPGEDRSTGA